MKARKCPPGVVPAAMAVMACTFLPGVEAAAAERAVRQHGERSTAKADRRAERKPARKPADRRATATEGREAAASKNEAAKQDDPADWVSIYPIEQ